MKKDLIKTFKSKINFAQDVIKNLNEDEEMHLGNLIEKTNCLLRLNFELGKIAAFEFAIEEIKECKLPYVDENAETLEDKLRVEHMPIPEEREDSNLFEILADKFRPKYE